ncbi:helix-turn-helix domain-containing protein [Actinokineospora sp. HUAS TT18]|uniref:helix-turn-helix domain-containing protein n=1 Tax=Actinokineospora sp. HUAS TT18 TaxID=3447451 RepID=UPI003F5203CA
MDKIGDSTQSRPPGPFLSVSEAADLMRVSPMSLYREIAAGRFPAVRIRSRLIVPARALSEMETAALETGGVVDPSKWV